MKERFRISKFTLGLIGVIVAVFAASLIFVNVNIPGERKLLQELELRESVFGKDSPQLVEPLSLLAIVYHVSDRYDKAEAVYERMLELDRKHLGPESREARGTLLSIADMADLQGNVERGDALYAEALKIDRKLEQAGLAELEGLKSKPTDTLSPEEKQALAQESYNKSNLGETLTKRIKAYREEGREELARQLERRKNKMGL